MCWSRPTVIDPVETNRPEAVTVADGAGVGVGLGAALEVIGAVGLEPVATEDVAPVPAQDPATKAAPRIATIPGLTRQPGELLGPVRRFIV